MPKWKIQHKKPLPDKVDKIESGRSIHQRPREKRTTNTGQLDLVPLPEDYFFKCRFFKQRHLLALQSLKARFKNNLFSFDESIECLAFLKLKNRQIARLLAVLWAHRKIEKFAASEFVEGFRRPGEVGKYCKVHYRCL